MSPELEFRQDLLQALRGFWIPTLHENVGVNPGCPDISYIMPGNECETGWLELKAINTLKESFTIKIEASQHQWMFERVGKVPIHFLIRVNDEIYFVDAKWRQRLNESITHSAIRTIAFSHTSSIDLSARLPWDLRAVTLRSRNGL